MTPQNVPTWATVTFEDACKRIVHELLESRRYVTVSRSHADVVAVITLLKGITEWITYEPTIEVGIVEDLARAIKKCDGADREQLRHLSVVIRDSLMWFQPDPSVVAPTETEAEILHTLEQTAQRFINLQSQKGA